MRGRESCGEKRDWESRDSLDRNDVTVASKREADRDIETEDQLAMRLFLARQRVMTIVATKITYCDKRRRQEQEPEDGDSDGDGDGASNPLGGD